MKDELQMMCIQWDVVCFNKVLKFSRGKMRKITINFNEGTRSLGLDSNLLDDVA